MKNESGSRSETIHKTVVEENIKLHAIEGPNYLERHPEQTNFYQINRMRRLIAEVARAVCDDPKRANGSTALPKNLDVACGTGYLLLEFLRHRFECTGVDLSQPMLDSLRREIPQQALNRVELVQQDIFEFMATHQEAFDVVSIGAALHHFNDFREVVQWACRSVAPGGWLVIAFEPLKQAISSPLSYRLHRMLARVDEGLFSLAARMRGIDLERDTAGADYQRRFGGIDPLDVAQIVAENGLSVVRVDRYCVRRYGLMAWMANGLIRSQNTFDLVARRSRGGT